jgi:catechol 2,3-dioxygenase-like lactoylglutathione lyase family enzyme
MRRITVVSVPVSDQDAAKGFYTEQVGFDLVNESRFGDELRWIQVGPRDSDASLTLVTWFDSMPPGSLRGLVVETDDLEADYQPCSHAASNSSPRPHSSLEASSRPSKTPTETRSASARPEAPRARRRGSFAIRADLRGRRQVAPLASRSLPTRPPLYEQESAQESAVAAPLKPRRAAEPRPPPRPRRPGLAQRLTVLYLAVADSATQESNASLA